MSDDTDDAQRGLEQRALRNVRGLVDKLETADRADRATDKRLAVAVSLVAVVVVVAAILSITVYRARPAAVVVQSPVASVPDGPRRRFVSSGKDTPFAAYVNQYSRRIEQLGNANYPSAIRGIHGTVQLTAAIRSDGSLERVEVNRSSGNSSLDDAAASLVRSAQPFESFAAYSLTDVDILHITRTFAFEKGNARDLQ